MALHVGFWTRSLALGLAVLLTSGCFACSSSNNLDLDEDGQVDYIRVREYGGGNTKNFDGNRV